MSTRPEITGRRAGVRPNNPPPAPIEPLLTKQQLAEWFGVAVWTIDRWRRTDPDFPAPIWITITTPRWEPPVVRKWLTSRRKGGLAPLGFQPREREKRSEQTKKTRRSHAT
jgi:hypothetical protein